MAQQPARPRVSRQKQRTRKELLRAAARLVSRGTKPSLEQVAEEALVSRATAYRYFPNVDALLLEASLDVAVPEPEALFAADAPSDPVARLERVEEALQQMIDANEAPLRMMLAKSLERSIGAEAGDVPARQNRRTALIEAALAPAAAEFPPAARRRLAHALAVLIGTESMVVCKDVLQLDDAEARRVRRWAIRALVAAARRERRDRRPGGAKA